MRILSFLLTAVYCVGLGGLHEVRAAGDPEAAKPKLPLCAGCHGAEGEGKEPAGGLPAYPALAGQIEAYLVASMLAYKTDQRSDPMMGAIAKALSEEDIKNLAAYYANLGK